MCEGTIRKLISYSVLLPLKVDGIVRNMRFFHRGHKTLSSARDLQAFYCAVFYEFIFEIRKYCYLIRR